MEDSSVDTKKSPSAEVQEEVSNNSSWLNLIDGGRSKLRSPNSRDIATEVDDGGVGDSGSLSAEEEEDVTSSSPSPADAAADAADTSTSPEKISSAPEPPRWRFVNEAKKTLGYSSLHAGSYIKGHSSDDLGAKYVAPDISLYQAKEGKMQPKKVAFQLPENIEFSKEDADVSKLDANAPSQDPYANQNNEVGKLQIHEDSANDMNPPSGSFAGLPRSQASASAPRNPFKEWDVNMKVGPKKGRGHEWHDGKIHDSYAMPSGDAPSKKHGKVGKLSFHGRGSGCEAFDGEVPKINREQTGKACGDNGSVFSFGDPREGALFVNNNDSTSNVKGDDDSTVLTEQADDDDTKRKNKWLFLLLMLLLALVVILGVMLGTRNDEEGATVAAVAGVVIPPIVVLNETSVPSSYPSASLQPSRSPSTQCPVDTKPFSIKHISQFEQSRPTSSINDATWKIKDACSGEVIAQCLPCSLKSVFQTQTENSLTRSQKHDEPTRYLGGRQVLRNLTECLPIDKEYVLEILPAEDSEPCCGFDPSSSMLSYDNVVVKCGASEGNFFSDHYFGEREIPCKSETPSVSPTIKETARPSPPTNPPTKICSTEKEFNLCIAIDMSGSVCNGGNGSECSECKAAFLSIFFASECKDSFVNENTCCNNFANVKEFSSTMVNLLGDFDAEKSFSVVQFSTTAQLVSSRLSSPELAVPVIDQLDYTGGLTNHASAIQTCQRSFPSSDDRNNFIMLITDGVSSEPGFDPEGAAEAAALSAKADGIHIIPVFISPNNDWSALAFMRRLSSDGQVFDVTDFDSLNSLQDRLIDQVSCA